MADEGVASHYQVLEELGRGSFGVVYKGIERATGETVAIKLVGRLTPDYFYFLCPQMLTRNVLYTDRSGIQRRRYPGNPTRDLCAQHLLQPSCYPVQGQLSKGP